MLYYRLRYLIEDDVTRTRAAKNLLALRGQLDATVPPKDAEHNLLLATWNIRDFGKPESQRRGWGPRLPEMWFYIAEIISRFDFVAVQEINELHEWEKVMSILGDDWAYIATDETDSKLGGNGERMAFVYDRRKVRFQSVAGEIVLPPKMLISKAEYEVDGEGTIIAGNQFKRTPFMAMFQSGWLKFDICTVHLFYGADRGAKLEQRIEEIGTIAKYLSERADRALGQDRALILLGDFNIVSPEHKTMQALEQGGFVVPKVLKNKPTTRTSKHYDQIAFKTKDEVLEYINSEANGPLGQNAGVVDLFASILDDAQFDEYKEIVRANSTAGKEAKDDDELKAVYDDWITYQLSDHSLMWTRLQIDGGPAYLARLAAPEEE